MRRTEATGRQWLIWVLMSCPLVAALAGQTVKPAPIASALKDRNFPKALELLEPALKAAPRNPELWAMQGTAYAGEGAKKRALASFQKSLEFAPDYLPALEGAIQIEYEAGSKGAIPLLERMLRLRPADAVSHGMLAVLEYQEGNCEIATTHFEKTGTLFDAQPTALHAFATCRMRLRQPAQAAEIFRKVLALNPDDLHERRLLASVELLANEPNDALATLQPMRESPDNRTRAETLELCATAYEENKDTPQAVSTLRQAILLDPNNVNLYLDFANLSYVHDSFQVGIDVVSDGIHLEPQAAALYFARGVLYIQLAQYEQGEEDFQKAYELDPTQSLSAAAQSLARAQQNDLDSALAKVESGLERKPDDAILLYLKAEILEEKGAEPGTPEFSAALRSATRAVTLEPSLAAARSVLATLELRSGRYREAILECRKALASDPKNQTALYHLIQALRKTGDRRELPDLLKRLAGLRHEAAREQSERYQYKLVDEDAPAK
jgi:tetratricopeptide (TPR) repeat protein